MQQKGLLALDIETSFFKVTSLPLSLQVPMNFSKTAAKDSLGRLLVIWGYYLLFTKYMKSDLNEKFMPVIFARGTSCSYPFKQIWLHAPPGFIIKSTKLLLTIVGTFEIIQFKKQNPHLQRDWSLFIQTRTLQRI